ncbi:unnamed protein product [Schistosoma curassoni]|uniref:RanBD1 domain-containing protein n=1 Tax=Schistosoma curassoni TaxID=6186 RepID=A0A183KNI7_9TREM|nr:unnamed protein product [Schistosoma curassoni]
MDKNGTNDSISIDRFKAEYLEGNPIYVDFPSVQSNDTTPKPIIPYPTTNTYDDTSKVSENKLKIMRSGRTTAIDSIAASTFNELERGVDTILLQYRNTRHSVTKETPSKLLKGRILRLNMRSLESAEVTYCRGNDLRPFTCIVLKNVGKSMVRILDINDLSTHSRHVDQIKFQEPGESVPIPIVNSNTNECILDNAEFLSNTMLDRLMMNLRRRRTIDYKHLDSNLNCGGCGF